MTLALAVHLTEGFQGETVRLSAGGAAATAPDVRSDTLTGLAQTVWLDVGAARTTLRAELDDGRSAEREIDPAALAFVVVELTPTGLALIPVTLEAYAAEPRGFA